MIGHILNETANQRGFDARQKINAVIDIINDLATNYLAKTGTLSTGPLTGAIEFLNNYGTAMSSNGSFFIGSGDDVDLDDAIQYNRLEFEAPVIGQRSKIYLSGQYTLWEGRNGTARNSITMNANGLATFIQKTAYDGTFGSSLVVKSRASIDVISDDPNFSGLLGAGDYSSFYNSFSFIQKVYAEKRYAKILGRDATDSVGVTSTTQTIVKSFEINPVDVATNDILKCELVASKSGTNGAALIKLYLNSSNSLIGAVEIAAYNPTASTVWHGMFRTFVIKDAASQTFGYNNASTVASDMISATTPRKIYNWDWTAGKTFFIVSFQNASALDTTTLNEILLTKY